MMYNKADTETMFQLIDDVLCEEGKITSLDLKKVVRDCGYYCTQKIASDALNEFYNENYDVMDFTYSDNGKYKIYSYNDEEFDDNDEFNDDEECDCGGNCGDDCKCKSDNVLVYDIYLKSNDSLNDINIDYVVTGKDDQYVDDIPDSDYGSTPMYTVDGDLISQELVCESCDSEDVSVGKGKDSKYPYICRKCGYLGYFS